MIRIPEDLTVSSLRKSRTNFSCSGGLEDSYLPKIALYQGERVRFVGESAEGELATAQSLIINQ